MGCAMPDQDGEPFERTEQRSASRSITTASGLGDRRAQEDAAGESIESDWPQLSELELGVCLAAQGRPTGS